MYRKQRGVTALGWLILLIPVAIVLYSAIRLTPVYLNYAKIVRLMDQMEDQVRSGDTAQAIRITLQNRLDVEGVEFPTDKDFTLRRDGRSWVLEIEYDDGAPLLSNVSITATFAKSVRMGDAPE